MILVKNFYDKNTFIKITGEGCFLIPSENLNCPTQGTGGFLENSELVCIFVYKKQIYFQYNESIYPLKNKTVSVINEPSDSGTRRFKFIIDETVVCDITYSEYIPASYSGQSSEKIDFLFYISQLLKDDKSADDFINSTELINNYYQ